MIQKLLRDNKGHRTARRHLTAAKADPLHFEQLIHRAARHGHAAYLFNLGAGDGLVIGDDRKRFDRSAAEFAGLDRFPMHQKAKVRRGAKSIGVADFHHLHAAPLIAVAQKGHRLAHVRAAR